MSASVRDAGSAHVSVKYQCNIRPAHSHVQVAVQVPIFPNNMHAWHLPAGPNFSEPHGLCLHLASANSVPSQSKSFAQMRPVPCVYCRDSGVLWPSYPEPGSHQQVRTLPYRALPMTRALTAEYLSWRHTACASSSRRTSEMPSVQICRRVRQRAAKPAGAPKMPVCCKSHRWRRSGLHWPLTVPHCPAT